MPLQGDQDAHLYLQDMAHDERKPKKALLISLGYPKSYEGWGHVGTKEVSDFNACIMEAYDVVFSM